jgi:hypothetical protein
MDVDQELAQAVDPHIWELDAEVYEIGISGVRADDVPGGSCLKRSKLTVALAGRTRRLANGVGT